MGERDRQFGRAAIVLFAVMLLASGCAAPVTVARVDQRTVYRELSSTALAVARQVGWPVSDRSRWPVGLAAGRG